MIRSGGAGRFIRRHATRQLSYAWWCPKTRTKNETESVANVSLPSSPFFFFLKIEKHIHCHRLWQLGSSSIQ